MTRSWSISPTCGAEVHGMKLGSASLDDVAEVAANLAEHGVVFFRDTGSHPGDQITPAEHLRFAKQLGEVDVNRFFKCVDSQPEIAKVEKTKEMVNAIGSGFHADHTYDLAPALGSLLVARNLPKSGGDTAFVDMRKAYDSLPDALKTQLKGLRAVHSSRHVFGQGSDYAKKVSFTNASAAVQDSIHPVVIRHPVSGKSVLFVNPGFTVHFEGQTAEESLPLLEKLYHHALQPSHMTRFRFEPGSAVLWDNRAVWHCALNDYQGQYRLMHRVTIEGTALQPAEEGTKGSEPLGIEPEDVLEMKWGQIPFDLPFVQHNLTTTAKGMKVLDPNMKPWWPQVSMPMKLVLRAASLVGMPLARL